jgi:GT2 family glycosyltransferase
MPALTTSELVALAAVALPALASLALAASTARAWRHLHRLPPAPATPPESNVSIVSPACNEQDAVAEAVEAMLATGSEVVMVNDRSSDGTGAVLDAIRHERLTVVHLDELPAGWLGKVHALHRGTERATGDWLLYADADAMLATDTVARAVAWMDDHGVDFLSLMPRVSSAGFLGDTVMSFAQTMLPLGTRPWAIAGADPNAYGATGAFMLVRRRALDRSEGFPWLRMEVSDDFGLSLLIKQSGGRIALLDGSDAVHLQWYGSLGEMADKLQKNLYAIMCRCRLWRCVAATLGIASLALLPLGLLFGGPAGWVSLGATALLVLTSVASARRFRRPLLPAFFVHVGALLTAAMTIRACFIGHRIGGIRWRGTHYSAEELDQGRRVLL